MKKNSTSKTSSHPLANSSMAHSKSPSPSALLAVKKKRPASSTPSPTSAKRHKLSTTSSKPFASSSATSKKTSADIKKSMPFKATKPMVSQTKKVGGQKNAGSKKNIAAKKIGSTSKATSPPPLKGLSRVKVKPESTSNVKKTTSKVNSSAGPKTIAKPSASNAVRSSSKLLAKKQAIKPTKSNSMGKPLAKPSMKVKITPTSNRVVPKKPKIKKKISTLKKQEELHRRQAMQDEESQKKKVRGLEARRERALSRRDHYLPSSPKLMHSSLTSKVPGLESSRSASVSPMKKSYPNHGITNGAN
ncbi:hypothetical protein HMI54_009613 [Coelomomyces lativittatus]|nr:hypothetical protein HMI56_003908 [Coelomomyces lativittatus]KAJ1501868.1 hypothetical protein HMI54_009613 [Coelomomyces lativittatus]